MAFDQSRFPFLGYGVGLRPQHYTHVLHTNPAVDWFEVISENFMVAGGRPRLVLERVREQYPVVLHGVSLSIGSTDPLNLNYVRELGELVRRIDPAWVSDHLCWTGIGGKNSHDLLPLPYTAEAVRHVAERIVRVQDMLGRQILIENVSSYLTYRHSTMPEWEFLTAVAVRADCGILLDINNIYVSAFNHGFDPMEYLAGIPAERVAQFHLAGFSDRGTFLHDTHDHPVAEPVWALYADAVRRFGWVSTLIEWDDDIPEFSRLQAEAARARAAAEAAHTRGQREGTHESRTDARGLTATALDAH
jgi:uncharacterized protein (UPF0276 family)